MRYKQLAIDAIRKAPEIGASFLFFWGYSNGVANPVTPNCALGHILWRLYKESIIDTEQLSSCYETLASLFGCKLEHEIAELNDNAVDTPSRRRAVLDFLYQQTDEE